MGHQPSEVVLAAKELMSRVRELETAQKNEANEETATVPDVYVGNTMAINPPAMTA